MLDNHQTYTCAVGLASACTVATHIIYTASLVVGTTVLSHCSIIFRCTLSTLYKRITQIKQSTPLAALRSKAAK